MALSMPLKLWFYIQGVAFAAKRSRGKYVNALDLLVDKNPDAPAEPCPPRHVQLLDGRCELSWEIPDLVDCRLLQGHARPHCNGRYYISGGNWTELDNSLTVYTKLLPCEDERGLAGHQVVAMRRDSKFLPCENEPGLAVKPPGGVRVLSRVGEEDMQRLRDLMDELPSDAWRLPNAGFGQDQRVLNYTQAVFHFPEDRFVEFAPYQIFKLAPMVHKWIEPMLLKIAQKYSYEQELVPAAPGFLRKSVPRLLLASLGPDMRQSAHIDLGASSLRPHKIHVPVIEPIKATLGIKGASGIQKFHLPVGYAYEVNNLHRHFAENLADERRVHLIFEYMPVDIGSTETDEIGPDEKEIEKKTNLERQGSVEAKMADENEL